MGSYSNLCINNYPVFTLKSDYYDEIVNSIFLPSEFYQFDRPVNQRNKIVWGQDIENDTTIEKVTQFKSTAKVCRERLELFGLTYEIAKKDFDRTIQENKDYDVYNFLKRKTVTYEEYLSNIKNIISSQERLYDVNIYETIQEYLHKNELCFEHQSINCALWSMLYVVPDNSCIEYDLTEIEHAGWISIDPKERISNKKIIVLTEGRTDSEFLNIGLELFYPHL